MSLAGLWFWSDDAPQLRAVFHGLIAGQVGDYVLLRFDQDPKLARGVMELVPLERVAREHIALFETEAELRKALHARGIE